MNWTETEYHVRYRRAWDLYRDPDMGSKERSLLETEMDAAQDLFEWEEFQAFKKTLPGFEEHWNCRRKRMMDVARRLRKTD